MKGISSLILLLCCTSLPAQLSVNKGIGQDYGLFEGVLGFATEKYDGHPFLQDDWQNVKITTISGDERVFDKGKLDIWKQTVTVLEKGKSQTANNHLILKLEFIDGLGDTTSYVKSGVDNELRFGKLLKKGKIKLFEIPTKQFNEVDSRQNNSSYSKKVNSSFSNPVIKRYISINNEALIELKTSKKKFVKVFLKEYQNEISKILKSEKPDLKNTETLISVLSKIEDIL